MQFVQFSPEVEEITTGEEEVTDNIIKAMASGAQIVREREGRSLRSSHAKAHAVVRGELQVLDGLPASYAQGLFQSGKSYPVLVRMAHVPGELLDDRRVSTPRGMAIKLLGVEGASLPLHTSSTQDFVLDTGKTFIVGGPKAFLNAISSTEAAVPLPEGVKSAVSTLSRGTNAALNAVGLNSPKLDFYGHPFNHPLGESYFSQTPYRWGDHIAKIAVVPHSPALNALLESSLDLQDENGLCTVVRDFFRTNPAEYEVRVQLCTDLQRMPVEDATVEWSEEESPYVAVARLVLPPQDSYSAALKNFVEGDVSFSPAHALAAHQPLGGINRVRMKAYEVMSRMRRRENGRPVLEVERPEQLPAA